MQPESRSISPAELFARLGTASAPKIIDVRRPDDFDKSDVLIASAFHREPDEVERWQKDLGKEDMVVVHCVHGRQVSQGVAAAMRSSGIDAAYLEGGRRG